MLGRVKSVVQGRAGAQGENIVTAQQGGDTGIATSGRLSVAIEQGTRADCVFERWE
jgi:hypothetical protein